jgi:hypothetical protein
MDADAGGAADLQTDVMRFMAILSLCLVAIFALVQSIPLAPKTEMPMPVAQRAMPMEPAAVNEPPPVPATEAHPVVEPDITLTRPQPQTLPPQEAPPVLQRPLAQKIEHSPAPPVDPQPQGFTLRFEDDVALTRLVARNEVGLYAILPDKSLRMNVNRGQMSFWSASMPKEFHEMDVTTVPQPVIDALQRGNGPRVQGLKWGVTIPAGTSRQLEQYLREASGGSLIIDARGALRLE